MSGKIGARSDKDQGNSRSERTCQGQPLFPGTLWLEEPPGCDQQGQPNAVLPDHHGNARGKPQGEGAAKA